MSGSWVGTFTGPEPYQAAIRAAHVEVFPTAKGSFRAKLTKIDLPRLWMQRGQENIARVAHAFVPAKRRPIFFLGRTDQPDISHSGMTLTPAEIMSYGPDAEHHHRTSAACTWSAMSLSEDDFNSLGRAIIGFDLPTPSETRKVRPPPALMSRLRNLHGRAAHLAETKPNCISKPAVARALEQELIHTMVRCLTEHLPRDTIFGSHRHLAIMAKFEQFLVQHCEEPVYLSDICLATEASERTLRVCCEENLGMGPIRYLWLRRMYLARHALADAVPGATSVTAIATQFGFWELGRFSVEYRALFGESPLVALSRARR